VLIGPYADPKYKFLLNQFKGDWGNFHQGMDPCDAVGIGDAACRVLKIPVGSEYQLNSGPSLSHERDRDFMVGGAQWNAASRFTGWRVDQSPGWFFGGIGGITAGPDKAMWFAEMSSGKVGLITMNGEITEYPHNLMREKGVIDVAFCSCYPIPSFPGPGLFFTLWGADRMGYMEITRPEQRVVQPLGLPPDRPELADEAPSGLAVGPDGYLWISLTRRKKIYVYPYGGLYVTPDQPGAITKGADNAMWFLDGLTKIGRMAAPQSTWSDCCHGETGTVVEFPVPTPNPGLTDIAAGADGALWFTEQRASKIGRITTDGKLSEFNLGKDTCPAGITGGPDGALWFAESCANKIGRIMTEGSISEIPIPNAPGGHPWKIAVGPDGNLWFTESGQTGPNDPKIDPKVERLQITLPKAAN
jgi:virginiamycin B lyase